MKTLSSKPKQKISPITLIIAGVGLITCIYFLLPTQSTPPPPVVNKVNSQPVTNTTTNNSSIVQNESSSSKSLTATPLEVPTQGVTSVTTTSQPISARDPFLPAVVDKKVFETPTPKFAIQPPHPIPITTPSKEDDSPKPIWNGTIGSNMDKLVLINFKGKPYVLRLGDLIPGTSYQIAEINNDSILLNSPKQSLRLYPKKEASNAKI